MTNKYLNIIIFTLVLFTTFSCNIKDETPDIEKAVVTIKNVEDNKIYNLNGNWEFYYKKLLSPSSIKNYNPDLVNYQYVSTNWNNYIIDNEKISGSGYGTYHLRLVVPPEDTYALQINKIYTSYKLWINNSLQVEQGKVGQTADNFEAKVKPLIIPFETTQDTTDIVIQVSNFANKQGGISGEISFGFSKTVYKDRQNTLTALFAFFGVYFFIALFFFLTACLISTNRKGNLYFSLTILSNILFQLVSGKMFILFFFPNLSWEILEILYQISIYGIGGFGTLFIYHFFEKEKAFNKKLLYIPSIAIFVLMGGVIFTPVLFHHKIYIAFLVLLILINIYLTFGILKLAIKKNIKARILTVMYTIYILTAINDILLHFRMIASIPLLNLGTFSFTFTYTILLSIITFYTKKTFNLHLSDTKLFDKIQARFLSIKSFDLYELLNTLHEELHVNEILVYIEKDNQLRCEAVLLDGKSEVSYLQAPLQNILSDDFFDKLSTNKRHIIMEDNYLVLKTNPESGHQKYIYFSQIEDKKLLARALENSEYELSLLIENYIAYYSEKNINNNFDAILEHRIEKIKSQEKVLLAQETTLKLKYKEITEAKQKVEQLNTILIDKNNELDKNISNIEKLNKKISEQERILTQNINIVKENLKYSKIIHNTLLNNSYDVAGLKTFLYNSPCNIISGDFLYIRNVEDKLFIVLLDLNSKDTIALFFSIYVYSVLEDIVENNKKFINTPFDLLKYLKNSYRKILKQGETLEDFNFFVSTIKKDGSMIYCGDGILADVVNSSGITSLVDKKEENSISLVLSNFRDKTHTIKPNSRLYLQTDGLFKQPRKSDNEKFGYERSEKFISELSNYKFDENSRIIKKMLDDWTKDSPRVDDYLIFGYDFES